MSEGGWFVNIIRTIFMYLDFIVYWLVDQIYRLFTLIADTGVFSADTIQEFGNRIYILLAIIMVFIVSFSMIKYIINPDEFLDQQKGVGKLLMNFFIVLIAIVTVPVIFKLAFELQGIVLKENIVGKIVLGSSITSSVPGSDDNNITDGGKQISSVVFAAFFKPNESKYGECQYPDYSGCGDETPITILKDQLGNNKSVLGTIGENIVNEKVEVTKTTDGSSETLEQYAIEYIFIISAIAGVFLAYILLVFCLDLAVRSVKLGFLQLVAPIPIVSLLDPRQKGNNLFNKWVQSSVSTYLGLFVRLIAIYFAIYVCTIVADSDGEIFSITDPTATPGDNILIKVFIIFGALIFAKELPKLLGDLTGMKFEGGSMKMTNAIGKTAAFGVGGAVGAGVASAAGNFNAARLQMAKSGTTGVKAGLGILGSTVAGGLAGGTRGLTRGVQGSLKKGGKIGIDEAVSQTRQNQERTADAKKVGYGAGSRMADRLAVATGGQTKAQLMEDAAKDFEKNEVTQAQEEFFNSQQNLSRYDGFTDDGQRLHLTDGYGTVTKTFDTSSDIDSQRELYMNEYTYEPTGNETPEDIQNQKLEWANARLAEEAGVTETEWKNYEQKIRTKDSKELARADYVSKQKDLHDKELELAKKKREAEKQKKVQSSYGIGSKNEKKK